MLKVRDRPPLSFLRATLTVALCSGGLAACGDDTVPEAYSTPTLSDAAGDMFDVDGVFAARQVLAQWVEEEPLGRDYTLQTINSFYVVTLEPGDASTSVSYRQDPCLTELSKVQGTDSTFLQGFYDHTPVVPYEASLSAPEIGATFTLPLQIELRGIYALEDPGNDPLPTELDDPNVYDFDGDGNPGYTVEISGPISGWLWLVERYRFSLDGLLAGADSISGLMTGESEQSILETSSFLIPDDTDIYPDDDPAHNFFEMYRVADDYTCERLLEDRDVLFPEEGGDD